MKSWTMASAKIAIMAYVYDDCAEPRHESGLMALAQGFLNDKYGYRSYGGRCGNADNETFEHIHQHKRKR